MFTSRFSAYVVERDPSGRISGSVKSLGPGELTGKGVVIRCRWSSLNYKDALAATGHPGVVRRFPHVPGIDAAGEVVDFSSAEATSPGISRGDSVLVTGFDLGAGVWGGWSEYICVPVDWVIPCPPQLSPREAMILGTAGFTAALAVDAITQHDIVPSSGEIVVTGATGGVGCLAVRLLAKLGYSVVAVTGKTSSHELLRQWGAREVISRESVVDSSSKPLLAARWAGAVDTVGGATLATLIRQTQNHGCVTACGLVGGTELAPSVYPFILRGVTLTGIDSAWCPRERRLEIWNKLATTWRLDQLDSLATETTLDEVGTFVPRILAGEILGRTIVRIGH